LSYSETGVKHCIKDEIPIIKLYWLFFNKLKFYWLSCFIYGVKNNIIFYFGSINCCMW
jgi:hypothetical protein